MPIPPQLRKKILGRLDSLIAEGQPLADRTNQRILADTQPVLEWGTKCASVLMQILPSIHPRRKELPSFGAEYGSGVNAPKHLAFLKAIRDDFNTGFLDDLGTQIEAEIASDYMGQAEKLLQEGQSGKYDHVPAAVLTGAVLEKALRSLCASQNPRIPTTQPDGKPLTMGPLIIALRKANVFPQTVAAQLEAWSHIRNKAAHGEFDQFNRQQVELMIVGARQFLATHLV